jgi:hypothetical protein
MRARLGRLVRVRAGVALAVPLLVGLAALTLSGCGGGGCLTPAEVDQEVNKIASGAEYSRAEVEAKQEEIREVRERACE